MSEHRMAHDPADQLLAELATVLVREPDQLTARRQVRAAASMAGEQRARRRGLAVRSGAAAVAAMTLVSTSGVAFAGRLPRPVQSIVADAARVLPVPLPIPYPTPPSLTSGPEADFLSEQGSDPASLGGDTPIEPEAGDSPAVGETAARPDSTARDDRPGRGSGGDEERWDGSHRDRSGDRERDREYRDRSETDSDWEGSHRGRDQRGHDDRHDDGDGTDRSRDRDRDR